MPKKNQKHRASHVANSVRSASGLASNGGLYSVTNTANKQDPNPVFYKATLQLALLFIAANAGSALVISPWGYDFKRVSGLMMVASVPSYFGIQLCMMLKQVSSDPFDTFDMMTDVIQVCLGVILLEGLICSKAQSLVLPDANEPISMLTFSLLALLSNAIFLMAVDKLMVNEPSTNGIF